MIQLKNNRNWFLSAKINALTPYRERVQRKRERERERYSYRKDVAFGSKRHEQSYRLPVSNSLHFLSFGRHGTPMVVSGRHHTSDTVSQTHGLILTVSHQSPGTSYDPLTRLVRSGSDGCVLGVNPTGPQMKWVMN